MLILYNQTRKDMNHFPTIRILLHLFSQPHNYMLEAKMFTKFLKKYQSKFNKILKTIAMEGQSCNDMNIGMSNL